MHHHRSEVRKHRDEEGASLVEYALLLALIAVVCFSAVTFFGNGGKGVMGNNADCVGQAMGDSTPGTCTLP